MFVARSQTTHTSGPCRRKLLPRRGLPCWLTHGCRRFCLSCRCSRRSSVRGLRIACAAAEPPPLSPSAWTCLSSWTGACGLPWTPCTSTWTCRYNLTQLRRCFWPFVARPVPPPWFSSFVRVLSVYIIYLGVMCVFFLAACMRLRVRHHPSAVLLLWHSLYCQ